VRVAQRLAPELLPARGRAWRLGPGKAESCMERGLRLSWGQKNSRPPAPGGLSILTARRTRGVFATQEFTHGQLRHERRQERDEDLVNNQPAVIIDTEYVKPGKGQAFTRVKYRLIKDGRTQEVTMKSTDSLDAADVVDTDMNFMYSDGEYWHFMDPESFEQVQATKAGMGGAEKWLKGEESCVVTLWNGEPIFVQPPNFVELKITETDPGVRGDTSGGGGKPATLETGAVVRVPLFVNQDEVIRVDTRSGEYSARVK
jgi:elongation factor P